MHDEQAVRERAYTLWQKEGSPEGREHEFWERARLMLESDQAPEMVTPLLARSEREVAVDDAVAQSFPASDPPSFAATTGAGNEPRAAAVPRGKVKSGRVRA